MIMEKMQRRKLSRKFYKIKKGKIIYINLTQREPSKLTEKTDTNIKAKNMNLFKTSGQRI